MGAVYANGLQLVRHSNVLLMFSVAADLGMMGMAISPFIPGFPATVPAAIQAAKNADPKFRRKVQTLQSELFGIPLPGTSRATDSRSPRTFGIYPAWMEWEGHQAARMNGFEATPLNVQFFYNLPSAKQALNCRVPSMGLRFRRADELLPASPSPLYSLFHDGQRHYFSEADIEPAQNPRDPGQKRVRLNGPSRFAGMWVRREKGTGNDPNPLSQGTGIGPTSWGLLRGLLKDIVLDVTHKDDPPFHNLALMGRMSRVIRGKDLNYLETSGVALSGSGLAAWDIQAPLFTAHLQKSRILPDRPISHATTHQALP
jgi:hypothetical protein